MLNQGEGSFNPARESALLSAAESHSNALERGRNTIRFQSEAAASSCRQKMNYVLSLSVIALVMSTREYRSGKQTAGTCYSTSMYGMEQTKGACNNVSVRMYMYKLHSK